MAMCYSCGRLIKNRSMYREHRDLLGQRFPIHAGCKRKHHPEEDDYIREEVMDGTAHFIKVATLCRHIKGWCYRDHYWFIKDSPVECGECDIYAGMYFHNDKYSLLWRLWYRIESQCLVGPSCGSHDIDKPEQAKRWWERG